MNHFLNGVARAVAESFDLPGPILEVGSYQVNGQEELADLRTYFLKRPYVGIDIRPGSGVDRVADVEALPFADQSFGTVIAMNAFEHVPHFWRGFEEVFRVLRPDGAFLVSCPFYFKVHNYPSDYWRFTPQSLELLLERYPTKITGRHGPSKRPANVWALAFREQHPPIPKETFETYRALLNRYAKQPATWGRQLRYQVGRLLCGRRPFAPYLDQERWESACENLSTR
jgi:SAM-dependent methyltransferase